MSDKDLLACPSKLVLKKKIHPSGGAELGLAPPKAEQKQNRIVESYPGLAAHLPPSIKELIANRRVLLLLSFAVQGLSAAGKSCNV